MSESPKQFDKRERFLRVVGELMPRINEAIGRITSGEAAMRIPVDKTDPDIVLGECSNALAYARDHLACAPSHVAEKVTLVAASYGHPYTTVEASAPSAMGTLTERERVVLGNLIHLADAVHHALDDSEELEDKSINVTEEHYNMLCLAVACLDDLPDDKPGYIMCPAAKAQWALRRIMGEQENNAADGGKQMT